MAEIACSGESFGWVGCFLEVNGLQIDQAQVVIGRFSFFFWGGGGGGGGKGSKGVPKEAHKGARPLRSHVRSPSVPWDGPVPGEEASNWSHPHGC